MASVTPSRTRVSSGLQSRIIIQFSAKEQLSARTRQERCADEHTITTQLHIPRRRRPHTTRPHTRAASGYTHLYCCCGGGRRHRGQYVRDSFDADERRRVNSRKWSSGRGGGGSRFAHLVDKNSPYCIQYEEALGTAVDVNEHLQVCLLCTDSLASGIRPAGVSLKSTHYACI